MAGVVIGDYDLPDGARLRVRFNVRDGHGRISLRRWRQDHHGKWQAGAGVSIPAGMLLEVAAQFREAERDVIRAVVRDRLARGELHGTLRPNDSMRGKHG